VVAVIASRSHYAAHMAPVAGFLPDLDVTLVAAHADLVKARRAGHRRIVLMQHGIGQSYGPDRHPAYPGGTDNDGVGLFLVPGEHPAERWRAAYPAARVEVVGSPRLDDLPRRIPGPGLTIACTFHWRIGAMPEMRNAFAFYGLAAAELSHEFAMIGHGHPRATRLPRFWAKVGIEYVPDFDEVCRRADVLVFDNTSAGYEFASTGRPVVVLNSPGYRKDVDFGLRFWDAADVGIQVDFPTELAPAVRRALELRPDDVAAREAALDIVYRYRTGAAQRAADTIRDWAA
jgi:hypothetical protein